MCSSLYNPSEQTDEQLSETQLKMENFWKISNLFQADQIPPYPLHQILRKRENRGTVIFEPVS